MEKPKGGVTEEEVLPISDEDLIVPEEDSEILLDKKKMQELTETLEPGSVHIDQKEKSRNIKKYQREIKEYFEQKKKDKKYGKQEELSLDNKK